jgi:hypothetical protein
MNELKQKSWLSRYPLWLEIGIALVLKVVLLYAIHQSFFFHPQAVNMQVPLPKIEQHLMSAPTVSSAAPSEESSSNVTK